ncbi:MAG: pilus assembly protein [Desulfobacterales bacterium CG23_combo_of_CG06-09_8_20_14_all_51_8]|nr:MAG: pilus assembly protein [Desulfobacterales bacterium CG23_combo_of_CG06-09_8_20_14_all_51_8]
MKLETFIQTSSNLYAENRLLKFVVVCIGIAVIINSFFSYAALQYQKVVILPPVVDKRITISGNEVNEDYVRLFTRYAMTLLNTYTTGSAQGQFEEFVENLVTPEFYPDIRDTLFGLVDTIKRLNITSAFYPQKIDVDMENKTITVLGVKKEFTNTTLVEDGKRQYNITYVIVNGRFYIDDIKELKN